MSSHLPKKLSILLFAFSLWGYLSSVEDLLLLHSMLEANLHLDEAAGTEHYAPEEHLDGPHDCHDCLSSHPKISAGLIVSAVPGMDLGPEQPRKYQRNISAAHTHPESTHSRSPPAC